MANKECKWCFGTISNYRFVVSLGYCLVCSLKRRDPRATAPSRSNKGKKVK